MSNARAAMPMFRLRRETVKRAAWLALAALVAWWVGGHYVAPIVKRIAPLKLITVHGGDTQTRALAEQILAEAKGDNLLNLNVQEWKEKLEALPGVHRAHIQRELPSELLVRLNSSIAVARWQDGSLVDIDGGRYTGSTDAVLPVFRGEEKRIADMATFYLMADKLLPEQIAQVEVRAHGGWEVFLTDGTLVHLGRQPLPQLRRFARHAPALAAQLPPLRVVDMRYARGFAVQVRREEDEQ